MNSEQRISKNPDHAAQFEAHMARKSPIGAAIGYAECQQPTPALSPIASQIEVLNVQLDRMGDLLGRLIDKAHTALDADPRDLPKSAESVAASPSSCELDGRLGELSRRLQRGNDLLNEVIHRIQL